MVASHWVKIARLRAEGERGKRLEVFFVGKLAVTPDQPDHIAMRYLLSFLLLICLAPASSAPANDFYTAEIGVENRGEGALRVGARAALAEVLVRVSGDRAVVENAEIRPLLANARDQLTLYSYRERADGLFLVVEFDEQQIKTMLRRAGASFWVDQRPDVLLWLVVDEPEGRRFASLNSETALIESLREAFKRRGVVLRLPLLDLQDAASLTPDTAWQGVLPRIDAASARYGVKHVLVGRYVKLTDGRHLSDWLHIGPGEQEAAQVSAAELDLVAQTAANLAVDAMAARYAVTLMTDPARQGLAVAVTGVNGLDDFQAVMALLRAIPVIERVRVFEIRGDELLLDIQGVTDASALSRLLPSTAELTLKPATDSDPIALQWSSG